MPVYALYGEEQPVETPGFAHIETIAARSSLHDWEIGTHRHRSFAQVLIVQQGKWRSVWVRNTFALLPRRLSQCGRGSSTVSSSVRRRTA
ncbi:hypothetical protein [Novosphingobium sp. 9]|uniref:hypothetical protein n=1 Tax=Novosphingobium sp. 9 TaxID=2025349 RepID=UPI0021B58BD9|nr:hypothetical protein [Novosphingobium sp. 9]